MLQRVNNYDSLGLDMSHNKDCKIKFDTHM